MPSRNLALLVGVGSFDDPSFKQLRFCNNDVDDMGRVLSNPDIAQFEVQKLQAPNRDQILKELDKSASRLQPEDKLIFYFAGHGKRSASGKLYLIAKDTQHETLRTSAVPIDQVLEIMQESRSSQRVMILDCCHSGAVGGEFRGEIEGSLQELARARGTCILAASTGIQLAEERESIASDGKGNGVFTRYIVEGLNTGLAGNGADIVTVDGLYDYAFNQVVRNSNQTPMKWVIGGVGNIVIGKSTSGGWQNQRKAIQEEFRNLHANKLISGAFLDRVIQLTGRDWEQLPAERRSFADLLLQFSRKDITLIELLGEKIEPEPQGAVVNEPPKNSATEPHRDPVLQRDFAGHSQYAFFDQNLVSLEILNGFFRYLLQSPFGPILVLLIGFVTAILSQEHLSFPSMRLGVGIATLLSGATALWYALFLFYREWSRIRRLGGFSLRSIFNILMLLGVGAGAGFFLIVGYTELGHFFKTAP